MKKKTYESIPWLITNDEKEFVPESPWALEANKYIRDSDFTLEKARDTVIFSWLVKGDLRPLQALFVMGKAPSPAVLEVIAFMMNPEITDPDEVPYVFQLKNRTGKRGVRNNPENDIRDYGLCAMVIDKIKKYGPGSYDAAIKEVAKETGVGEKTVKDAYDKYKKSSLRQE